MPHLSRSHSHIFITCVVLSFVLYAAFVLLPQKETQTISETEPTAPVVTTRPNKSIHPRLRALDQWQRPSGPPHVALQIGHLNAASAPNELKGIRKNTGAQHGAMTETKAMIAIANHTKSLLEKEGVMVTILPVTIPPNFYADVFLSLHADGSTNTSATGYKVAGSWHDITHQSDSLVSHLETHYGEVTGLAQDPHITSNMRGYYGFNWRKYKHSAHPMSVSAIVETGFLTNALDRTIIVHKPQQSATGITNGVLSFLREQNLLS